MKGQSTGSNAADQVVEEIKKKGGQAVANYDSVEFGDKIIETAMKAFGRVDVVINNAGILRDVSMVKMTDFDWDLIMKVHMKGTYSVTKAAWNIMRKQGFGRVVNTSSASGLYGSFGQANYAAAKLGIHGFTQTLAKEGEKNNIKVNSIAPVAASRMTETVMPPAALAMLKAEYIVPLVEYLSHETCEETGSIFEVAAGYIAKLRWQRTQGSFFDLPFTAEQVRDKWSEITDFSRQNDYPKGSEDTFPKFNENLERIEKNKGAKQEKTVAKASAGLAADGIFELMRVYLDRGEGKEQVKKVDAVFNFEIKEQKNGQIAKTYVIDLKNG